MAQLALKKPNMSDTNENGDWMALAKQEMAKQIADHAALVEQVRRERPDVYATYMRIRAASADE